MQRRAAISTIRMANSRSPRGADASGLLAALGRIDVRPRNRAGLAWHPFWRPAGCADLRPATEPAPRAERSAVRGRSWFRRGLPSCLRGTRIRAIATRVPSLPARPAHVFRCRPSLATLCQRSRTIRALSFHPMLRKLTMTYQNLLVETRERVAIITLHRPAQLNALSEALAAELAAALQGTMPTRRSVIVITGDAKAFAAARISARWQNGITPTCSARIPSRSIRSRWRYTKAGDRRRRRYALGGGCELAMMCDLIVAANTAKLDSRDQRRDHSRAGRHARLPRAVGKAKAMDSA